MIKKAEKESRRKVGTFVLPRRLEVVGVLVSFVYFYITHNACLLAKRARKELDIDLTGDVLLLLRVYSEISS